MLKKIISIVVSLCLILSISVIAENENLVNEEAVPEVSQQVPQNTEELPQSDRNMGMPPSGDMQNRGTRPNMPNGEVPPEGMNRGQRPSGNFTPPQNAGEFVPPVGEFVPGQNKDANNNVKATTPQTNSNTQTENSQAPGDSQQSESQMPGGKQFGGQMPGGMGEFWGNMQNFNGQVQEEQPTGFWGFVKTNSTPITSVILLALAFIFVIFYRRKNY